MSIFAYSFYTIVGLIVAPVFLCASVLLSLLSRLRRKATPPRLVWGPTPIMNNKYWSQAMRRAGYSSQTLMHSHYERINDKSDFDEYVFDRYTRIIPRPFKLLLLFWESLFRFDVFFISNDGWLLGKTPYWRFEAWILKLSRKKIVILPYGGDCFVYRNVRSTNALHALLLSYPDAARHQEAVSARVNYWMRHGDAVIPGCANPDGFGRWSVMLPSMLHIDIALWNQSKRNNTADGKNGTVMIAHAPNHTGFKGTEFIIHAVETLRAEGLNVELRLLQNMKNTEVRRVLSEDIDILAEALIYPAYALNALEGMACGLPVLSNLEDEDYTLMQRRWSFLDECPIVSTSPETILDNLRLLVTRPELREQLGTASRQYVEKYHSLDAAAELYGAAIEYVYGNISGQNFMNLYHPLLGKYKDTPRILHPLVCNRVAV
jgi:glycosyltransferase involved in cell wall biosynthesis